MRENLNFREAVVPLRVWYHDETQPYAGRVRVCSVFLTTTGTDPARVYAVEFGGN